MATITSTATAPQTPNTVYGTVTDANGGPLANLRVEIYDVDMREWQVLANTVTNKEGKYEMKWTYDQLTGREIKTADIGVKIFSRENKAELYKSSMDEVRFNASPREEINITITTAIMPEVVEYDYILSQVSYLAEKIAITDLQESKEHRDITFLSKETEIPAEKIEHLVVAHHLQAVSKIDAAFFYALLRKNTLLRNDYRKVFNTRLSIDINTETLPLLYDAALIDEKTIQQDIKTAVQEMLVSAKLQRESKKYIEQLRTYKQQAEEYYKNEHPKKLTNIITRFVVEDKIGEMAKLLEENKNDPGCILQKDP